MTSPVVSDLLPGGHVVHDGDVELVRQYHRSDRNLHLKSLPR